MGSNRMTAEPAMTAYIARAEANLAYDVWAEARQQGRGLLEQPRQLVTAVSLTVQGPRRLVVRR